MQSLEDSTYSSKMVFFSIGNNEIELEYKVNEKNTEIELILRI